MLSYESKTTNKREQYNWRAEKNLNGMYVRQQTTAVYRVSGQILWPCEVNGIRG